MHIRYVNIGNFKLGNLRKICQITKSKISPQLIYGVPWDNALILYSGTSNKGLSLLRTQYKTPQSLILRTRIPDTFNVILTSEKRKPPY